MFKHGLSTAPATHVYLPISLAICVVVQSTIALVLEAAPVGFGLLLSDVYEHSHGLDLGFRTLKHMDLKLLHDQDIQLAAISECWQSPAWGLCTQPGWG